MEVKFKRGDRIVVIERGNNLEVGMTGIVLEHSTAPWISWDGDHPFMHDCTMAANRIYPGHKSLWCSSQHRLALDGSTNIESPSKTREW